MKREPTEMETRCNEAGKKAFMVDRKPLGISITREIIRALRDPTPEMGRAMYAAFDAFGPDVTFGPEEAIAVWRAGVDAACPPEST